MGNDREFMGLIAKLREASQKPHRLDLMARLMAVYMAATEAQEAVIVTETDAQGVAIGIALKYLEYLATDLVAGAQPATVAETAANTLDVGAIGLAKLAVVLDLATQRVCPAGVGEVQRELARAAKSLRTVVGDWRKAQKTAAPEAKTEEPE